MEAVCIYEGYDMPHTVKSVGIGGDHLNEWMGHLLANRGYAAGREIVRDVKEKLCYVVQDYTSTGLLAATAAASTETRTYVWADGPTDAPPSSAPHPHGAPLASHRPTASRSHKRRWRLCLL